MDSTRNRPPDRLEGNGDFAQPTTPAVANNTPPRGHPSDEELFAARVAALIKERNRLLRMGLIHRLQHLKEAILLSESGQSAALAEALSSTSLSLRRQSPVGQHVQPSRALSVLLHDQRTANFVPTVHSPLRIRHPHTRATGTTAADLTITSRAATLSDASILDTRQTHLSADTNVIPTTQAQPSTDASILTPSQTQLSVDTHPLPTSQARLSADTDVLRIRRAPLPTRTSAAGEPKLSSDADLPAASQAPLPATVPVPGSGQPQENVNKNKPAIRSILVGSPLRDAKRPKPPRRVSFAIETDTSRRVAEMPSRWDASATEVGSVDYNTSLAMSVRRALSAIVESTADDSAAEGAIPRPATTSGVDSANVESEAQPQTVMRDERMHFTTPPPSPHLTDSSRDMPFDPTTWPDRERGQVQYSPLLPGGDNFEFRWRTGVDSASRSNQTHESKCMPVTTLAERVDTSGSTRVLACNNQPQANSGSDSQSLSRPEIGLTAGQDHIVSGQSVSGILPCELHLFANYLSQSATPLTIDRLPVPPVRQENPDNPAPSTGLLQLQRTAKDLTKLWQSDSKLNEGLVGSDPHAHTSSAVSREPVQQVAPDTPDSQSRRQAPKRAIRAREIRAHRSSSPSASRSFSANGDGILKLGTQFFYQELHQLFDEKFRLTQASREQSMVKAADLCKQFPSSSSERSSPTSLIKGGENRLGSQFSFSKPDSHLPSSTTRTHRSDADQHPSTRSESKRCPIFPSSVSYTEIGRRSPFLRDILPTRLNNSKSPLSPKKKNGIHEHPADEQSSSLKNFQRRTYLNMTESDERRSATAPWQPDITYYTPLSNELAQALAQQSSSHVAYAFASNTRGHSIYHKGQGGNHLGSTRTTPALNFGFQKRTNYINPFQTTNRQPPIPVEPGVEERLSAAAETASSSDTAVDGFKSLDKVRFAYQSITDYGSNDKNKTEQIFSIGNDGKLRP